MTQAILRISLCVSSTICLLGAIVVLCESGGTTRYGWLAGVLMSWGVVSILLAWLAPRLGARGLRKGYGQPIPTDYDGLPDCDDLSASDGLPESDAEVRGEDFNSQFDSYKRSIEEWLQSDRPYLNADFSLQEVINRFNLNRTYASRIFNEGFGQSFILVMRHYRIEYAKELLRQNPGISITEVAQQCGYSTVQAFHKAFAYCNGGLTPGRYAQSLKG